MTKIWIFRLTDYRKVLQRILDEDGSTRGYRTMMSQAAGCQPAYMSQVIRGTVHLTPEQASGLCELWNLNDIESDYFITLVLLGRAGSKGLEQRLLRKLEKLREQHEKEKGTELRGTDTGYSREKALAYYFDWIPSAVHILLTVPGFDHPPVIAKRLCIDESVILNVLTILQELGIAKLKDGYWKTTTKSLYASDVSLFAPHHHRNWREKAAEYFRQGKLHTNLHYTSVFSLDKRAFQKIRDALDHAIKNSRQTALAAPEETISCINIDWFEI